jgi:glycosyltransferase involved in cell wall biosynthesis
MQIVFCNKYFFLNGGTETYLHNIMEYLSAMGHTTIPFSVRYADTWPSAYQDYFLGPPGDPDHAHLSNIRFSPANILRFLDRSTYSFEARTKLSRLLEAIGGADIAYVLNIYNYMSPSIFHTFKRHHIPVVMQIGDYNLICPSYSLLRNGRPCTLCVRGQYYNGFKHRCVKNHLAASAVRVAAMYVHRLLRLYDLVDAIVVPCQFMKSKLIEGGFSENRTHVLEYPVERRTVPDNAWHKKKYVVYFGRISYEKGIDTLIGAFQNLNPPADLYIIGRSYDGEVERLQALIQPHAKNRIHFLGFQTGQTLTKWVAEALFSVVPSRWYDNAPLSIYESFLNGTPVLASRIGGIPEQVQEGVTGHLFEPDSCDDLAQKMDMMLSDKEKLIRMGIAGQSYVKENLSIKDQMDSLMTLFETVIADYKRR